MNNKTIATIALKDGVSSSLEETLREAARWVEVAAARGADLAVLPETINLQHRKGDSAPIEDFALDAWQQQTALLCEAAAKLKIALALPLLVRDQGVLANRFYLLNKDGSLAGQYQKRVPAPGEKESGVAPGLAQPILWEGLRVGGAVCFDVYYPQAVFDPQLDAGADLFLIPSMTPAGGLLDYYALVYGVPFVLSYSAWSRILDRDGTELAAGGYRSETLRFDFGSPVLTATINFDAVTLFADFNQAKMRDVERHYGSAVRIRFDQSNCLFTLESRSESLQVKDIMREFDLISRRDYFARHAPGTL